MEVASQSNTEPRELQRPRTNRSQEIPLEAYKRATASLEDREDTIDPSTFKKFSPRLIREDQARVEAKKKRIAAESTQLQREIKRLADVFEVIFTEQAELSD